MTALKWEEGKTYRIKPDMVDKYTGLFDICKDIHYQLGYEPSSVQNIDREGRVTKLVEISNDTLDIDYWFFPEEIKYFYLVEHAEDEQEMTTTKTEQEVVVEWLGKLHHVMLNDDRVEDIRPCPDALILSTTLSDIYGIEQIYDFIQMRHHHMMVAEVGRRKKELLDQRAELEIQLAQINKELGEVCQ